jgi:predicted Rossmann fold flavoprotein
VLLIDHAEKVAEKIRISGGGRCNFTNIETGPANFDSTNPDFCRSALARYTPRDFIALVERHGIAWHEKHKGQLFCDGSSAQIVDMLLAECASGAVERWQPCAVQSVEHDSAGFRLGTSRGRVETARLVVATGGLSIPKIGASDWGYALARQFGHAVIETRPALVPLVCSGAPWQRFEALSGLSLPVRIEAASARPSPSFDEDLLFTHRGLSGPAVLQISTFWRPGESIAVDLVPGVDLAAALRQAKAVPGRRLAAVLADLMPRRLVEAWLQATPELGECRVADLRDRELDELAAALKRWQVVPAGSEGYRKAEVTAGGVDTRELDSRTCQSRRIAGLYFIGEVVDVTGWLGGYNFQWAWASAAVCARALGPVYSA